MILVFNISAFELGGMLILYGSMSTSRLRLIISKWICFDKCADPDIGATDLLIPQAAITVNEKIFWE